MKLYNFTEQTTVEIYTYIVVANSHFEAEIILENYIDTLNPTESIMSVAEMDVEETDLSGNPELVTVLCDGS